MEKEIGILDIFKIFKKRTLSFLIATVGVLALTVGFSLFSNESIFMSTVTLIVGEETERNTEEYNNITGEPIKEEYIRFGKHNISTQEFKFYESILQNHDLIEKLIEISDVDLTTEEMKKSISLKAPEDSGTLLLSVSSQNLDNVDQIADDLAILFEEKVFSITEKKAIEVLDLASKPERDNTTDIYRNITASIIISIVFGFVYVIILEFTDKSIKSAKEVEDKIKVSVLGQINKETKIEDLKKIRTRLKYDINSKDKNLITFAALDGETKNSLVDLAKVFSELNHKILLIDADFRKPNVHLRLDLSNEQGLSNVLEKEVSFEGALNNSDNYHVLLTGTSLDNPSEKLSSKYMDSLLKKAKDEYDYTFLNGHSLKDVTDTVALSRFTDGIILFAEVGHTRLDDLIETKKLLDSLKIEVLGVILNQ